MLIFSQLFVVKITLHEGLVTFVSVARAAQYFRVL